MLKLASLGMFSFSLGQTVLCIGRNKTSCETYGYNACEYQVPTRSFPQSPTSNSGVGSLSALVSGLAFVSSWRRSCHTTTCPQRAPCTTPQRCYSSPGFRSHPSHQPTSNPDKRWLREESSEECGNSDGSLSSAPQCWENSVGEELYKLIIFNFLLTVAFAFLVTLPRR